METLYAIIISSAIIICILIIILHRMAKLKEQNDRIYQNALYRSRDSITKELVKRAKEKEYPINWDKRVIEEDSIEDRFQE